MAKKAVGQMSCPFCNTYFDRQDAPFLFTWEQLARLDADVDAENADERVYVRLDAKNRCADVATDGGDALSGEKIKEMRAAFETRNGFGKARLFRQQYARDGMPMEAEFLPPGGWRRSTPRVNTVLRCCPKCHQPLWSGDGAPEVMRIGLIGRRSCGKTVYITVLIDELTRVAARSGATLTPYNRRMQEIYQPYRRDLYERLTLPRATKHGGRIDPFVYVWEKGGRAVTLSFQDMAGEDLDYDALGNHPLKRMDKLLVLVDPMEFEDHIGITPMTDEQRAAQKSGGGLGGSDSMQIFTMLRSLFTPSELREKDVAVALTKLDMLNARGFGKDDAAQRAVGDAARFMSAVGQIERGKLNEQVRDLIAHNAPTFLGALNSTFRGARNMQFFAVSALGSQPYLEKARPERASARQNPYAKLEDLSGGLASGFLRMRETEREPRREAPVAPDADDSPRVAYPPAPVRIEEPILWFMANDGLL